jgi:hypothetical protein
VNTLLNLLALVGGAAAAWHMVRAALRFLRGGASGVWADEMARTHARHGDLTSLDESRRERAASARRAGRSAAESLGWLVLLAAPAATSIPRALYACYTVFWLGPAVRRLRRRGGGPERSGR